MQLGEHFIGSTSSSFLLTEEESDDEALMIIGHVSNVIITVKKMSATSDPRRCEFPGML